MLHVFYMLRGYSRASIISSIVIEYISEFVTDIYEQISAIYLGLRDAGSYRASPTAKTSAAVAVGFAKATKKQGVLS
jgi:hypothetical protein